MATAKPLSVPLRSRRTRRIVVMLAIVAAIVVVVLGPRLRAYAVAGASVGARIACSCRFVAGRELSDCRKDFEPGMGLVMLSEDEAAKSVTARLLPLSRETAVFRQGEGCTLENWRD